MPFQISETTWWLLLGVLLGLILFWLIDKLYRRDGDYAAQRERREVTSLNRQVSELREESVASQQRLTERSAEVKRLNTLSEEMRDSVRGKEQQVTNLETALAAAREQQAEVEPLRSELVQMNKKATDLESQLEQDSAQSKQAQESAAKLQTELQSKEKRIGELTTQLGNTTQSYEKTLDEMRADHARVIEQKNSELTQLQSKVAQASTRVSPGIAAAATGSVAAVAASAVSGPSEAKPADDDGDKKSADKTSGASQSETETPEKPAAADSSSLAARHSDGPGKSDDDDADQPGLLDRLRGAFSGRRPDDLD